MALLMLYYHCSVSCICKGGISVSLSCDLELYLNRLSLAALVAYPIELHSALLLREHSQ